jgi:hypothetical protein
MSIFDSFPFSKLQRVLKDMRADALYKEMELLNTEFKKYKSSKESKSWSVSSCILSNPECVNRKAAMRLASAICRKRNFNEGHRFFSDLLKEIPKHHDKIEKKHNKNFGEISRDKRMKGDAEALKERNPSQMPGQLPSDLQAHRASAAYQRNQLESSAANIRVKSKVESIIKLLEENIYLKQKSFPNNWWKIVKDRALVMKPKPSVSPFGAEIRRQEKNRKLHGHVGLDDKVYLSKNEMKEADKTWLDRYRERAKNNTPAALCVEWTLLHANEYKKKTDWTGEKSSEISFRISRYSEIMDFLDIACYSISRLNLTPLEKKQKPSNLFEFEWWLSSARASLNGTIIYAVDLGFTDNEIIDSCGDYSLPKEFLQSIRT